MCKKYGENMNIQSTILLCYLLSYYVTYKYVKMIIYVFKSEKRRSDC